MGSRSRKGLRWRQVRGANCRGWCRATHGLTRSCHFLGQGVERSTAVAKPSGSDSGDLLRLPFKSRVGLVVDSRMSSQIVRATEALTTSGKHARMRLFSSVRANMSNSVFKSMKGSIAQIALVRTSMILVLIDAVPLGVNSGRHENQAVPM
jgi:hypothetical protein